MPQKILLITPPFTQLNTPYPATAYLKGFLDRKDVEVAQYDLSIELFLTVFSEEIIRLVFEEAAQLAPCEYEAVWHQREEYIAKVEVVIAYLQNHEVTAAYRIAHPSFLPKAHRSNPDREEWQYAFGNLGILDKAKHIATLFIEELGDFIRANIDDFFAFTNYAEKIAMSASSFDELEKFLQYEPTLIENKLLEMLDVILLENRPNLICFTIPFPGNLFAALRCAQYVKSHFPAMKIAFGGGYCNTELRALTDPRIFDYVDFISMDDGEIPVLRIIEFLDGKIEKNELERTYVLENDKVAYINKIPNTIVHHRNLPAPSYQGLKLDTYLSFLDVMNPMHRLWSDGRWNKLTVSHGCYWKQCTFCDVHLDYIRNYQNTTAEDLVEKIEAIIQETGTTGFHFVDEAAPPKMLRAMAELLIKKKVFITWWTNIRFEKTFDNELCKLLAKSGCIAVTGGLEVASDRLLKKMKKGVDIAQVARVTKAFADHDIMVHAYLMYGFPTETEQETIDSLEIVRQLFETGCIQSAFWHQLTTTAHSPIGKDPAAYDITIIGPKFEGFAQNELWHEDPQGAEHHRYKDGLNKALHNFLHGIGFDVPIHDWFDFNVVETSIEKELIKNAIR